MIKRRLTPALIAMILAGALAVQAQAQPPGSVPAAAPGKAAIDRFAGRLTYEIASGRSTAAMSWQISACRAHGDDTVCTGEWIFTGEKCSTRIKAVRTGSTMRVRELGKLACSREAAAESGAAPSS
jgi:hypothetical protein